MIRSVSLRRGGHFARPEPAVGFSQYRLEAVATPAPPSESFVGTGLLALHRLQDDIDVAPTPGRTVTASGHLGETFSEPSYAVDGLFTLEGWYLPSPRALPEWLQVDLPSPVELSGYTLGGYPNGNNTGFPNRSITQWRLLAKNPGDAEWTVLDEDGELGWNRFTRFSVAKPLNGGFSTAPPTVIAGGDVNPITGTSLNITLSEDVEEGDLIVLAAFGRSAMTPPAGFDLVITQENSALGQRVEIYTRFATALDSGATLTLTQASSGRMGVAYLAARGASGVLDAAGHTDGGGSPAWLDTNLPNILAVVAATNVYAASSGNTLLSAPDGYTVVTVPSRSQNRLILAHLGIHASRAPWEPQGGFTGTSSTDFASAVVLIKGA